MPLATSIAWQFGTEAGQAEEGKIDIHMSSIFLNGVKKKRIIDLSGPPQDDGLGSMRLLFNCGGEISAKLIGGPAACEAFAEDCDEVTRKKTGTPLRKRKLAQRASDSDLGSPCKTQQSSASLPISSKDGTEFLKPDIDLPEPEKLSAEELKAIDILKDSVGKALKVVSETSASRPVLTSLSLNLSAGSLAEGLAKSCTALDGRLKKQDEVHQEEKKNLRAEVCEAQGRCERLLKGREALEKQLKSLGVRLNQFKEDNANLERKLRGERTGPPPATGIPASKRARSSKASKAGPAAGGQEEFIRSLVALEVGPLLHCNADAQEALKKKILLKWHPDKQPSDEHRALATQVMQELQNCEAWKTK